VVFNAGDRPRSATITAGQVANFLPDDLCTGDIVQNVPTVSPAKSLIWVEDYGNTGTGPYRRCQPPAPEARGLVLQRGIVTNVILLSYACEIDKGIERFNEDQQSQPTDVCIVSAVGSTSRKIDQVMHGEVWSAFFLPGRTGESSYIVDFSSFQPISTMELVRCARLGRIRGLNVEGQTGLLKAFAQFLGAGREWVPDTPPMYARACEKLDALERVAAERDDVGGNGD